MMDEFELLRDYIDVLIWPLVIAGIVALVTNRFRDQIEALINRIQTVRGPGGSEILAPLEEQKDVTGEATATETEVEPSIPEDIQERLESGDAETKAAALLRLELANTKRALYYERVYRVLWGTQISFLQTLNERPDGVAMTEVILTYVENHNKAVQQFNPSYKNDLATYMTFLSREGLVQFKEPSSYVITELGVGILTYITQWGLPLTKWY
jgi:hypothetical protein